MPSRLRVVICDDHQVFTDALVTYLRDLPDFASVEAVHSIDDALRLVRHGADILLLDLAIDQAEDDGLDAVEALHHLGIDVPILILSGSQDVVTIARAMRMGATGFCTKDVHPDQLVAAIRRVVAGEVTLPSHMTEQVFGEIRRRQTDADERAAVLARLTPREREVLRLLSTGKDSVYIARALDLSPNTIRTHVQHILRKLGVHTQLHAAAEGRRLFSDATI
jgi:DNA-binding NarL/FixJ family response regulator